jgi:hypothetical protein
MPCIITGCPNPAPHNIGVRLRREDTSAIWAPNTHAFLCDDHAAGGMTVEVILTPNTSGEITTIVSDGGGATATRVTPIVNVP